VAIHFTSFPAIGYSKFTRLPLGVLVLIKDLCAMAPTLRIPNPFPGMNGFHGNDTIASGDDVFLLQNVAKF
jgi:hypothetical protein